MRKTPFKPTCSIMMMSILVVRLTCGSIVSAQSHALTTIDTFA